MGVGAAWQAVIIMAATQMTEMSFQVVFIEKN